MNFFLVLVYGISLSMDAFAVAICKGLALKRASWRDAITVGAYFGVFQGLMPPRPISRRIASRIRASEYSVTTV